VLSGSALALLLLQRSASARPPAFLLSSTARTAALVAAGEAFGAANVSVKVAALTGGVLKSMLISKLKIATVLVMTAGLLGTGLRAGGLADPPKNEANNTQAGTPAASNKNPDKPPEPQRVDPLLGLHRQSAYERAFRAALGERLEAPKSADDEFISRVYLDIVGRHATPNEIKQFKDAEALWRSRLVEILFKEVAKPAPQDASNTGASELMRDVLRNYLTELHNKPNQPQPHWKYQDCKSCHVQHAPVPVDSDKTVSDRLRQEVVRDLLVRQAVRDVNQRLNQLKEDLPDRQTELDALDQIEKAVRVLKEKAKERKD
jgi:hypothetical protein